MNLEKIIEYNPLPPVEPVEVSFEESLPQARKYEGEVVRIIEALKEVESSHAWSTLKTLVFDGVVGSLESRRNGEAAKPSPDLPLIHRLNGQIMWARRYADLGQLATTYRLELQRIRTHINGN